MKKKYLLFLFILFIISILIMSCGGHFFNPRYYYNKKGDQNSEDGNEISGGNSGIFIQPSADEDPFTAPQYKNEWWNNPNNAGFTPEEIDSWFLKVNFLDQDYPNYKFLKDSEATGHTWKVLNPEDSTYTDSGAICNTTAITGMSILPVADVTGVTYTKYQGMNTRFFTADGYYHTKYPGKEKISRFNFYYFVGTPKMAIELQNCLIAVDKYSKLLFYYGRPESDYPNAPSWVRPNATFAPNKYSPTSYWVSIDEGIKVNYQNYPFYEYDPVGYVKKDGTVVIFDWFADRLKSSHNNDPIKSDPNGPIVPNPETEPPANTRGRSPYAFYAEVKPRNFFKVTIVSGSIYNINSQTANRNSFTGNMYVPIVGGGKLYDYANFNYIINIAGYNNLEKPSYKTIAEHVSDRYENRFSVNIGQEKSLSIKSSNSVTINYGDENDIYLNISYNICKYDEIVANITDLGWKYMYSEDNKIYIILKYNKFSNSFTVDSVYDEYKNRLVEYDTSFELPLGVEKEFSVTLDGQDGDDKFTNNKCGHGATGFNNKLKIKLKLLIDKTIVDNQ
ncbi:hypothetical protein [Brachyspira sp.]|uniref:hypothetical protein n=1 Tax=Brachyspira sp. TaxID=1977261 RepID=UPI002606EC85|nr:hypothetical protein [Brachyspira sp.]